MTTTDSSQPQSYPSRYNTQYSKNHISSRTEVSFDTDYFQAIFVLRMQGHSDTSSSKY